MDTSCQRGAIPISSPKGCVRRSEVVCHLVSVKPQINWVECCMRDVPAEAFFLYAKWKVESADEELAAKSLTGGNSRLLLLSLI